MFCTVTCGHTFTSVPWCKRAPYLVFNVIAPDLGQRRCHHTLVMVLSWMRIHKWRSRDKNRRTAIHAHACSSIWLKAVSSHVYWCIWLQIWCHLLKNTCWWSRMYSRFVIHNKNTPLLKKRHWHAFQQSKGGGHVELWDCRFMLQTNHQALTTDG